LPPEMTPLAATNRPPAAAAAEPEDTHNTAPVQVLAEIVNRKSCIFYSAQQFKLWNIMSVTD